MKLIGEMLDLEVGFVTFPVSTIKCFGITTMVATQLRRPGEPGKVRKFDI